MIIITCWVLASAYYQLVGMFLTTTLRRKTLNHNCQFLDSAESLADWFPVESRLGPNKVRRPRLAAATGPGLRWRQYSSTR